MKIVLSYTLVGVAELGCFVVVGRASEGRRARGEPARCVCKRGLSLRQRATSYALGRSGGVCAALRGEEVEEKCAIISVLDDLFRGIPFCLERLIGLFFKGLLCEELAKPLVLPFQLLGIC